MLELERSQVADEKKRLEERRDQIENKLITRNIEIEKKQKAVEGQVNLLEKRQTDFLAEMRSLDNEKEKNKENQNNLVQELEDLKDQRLRIDVQYQDLNNKRKVLLSMAEKMSLTGQRLAERFEATEQIEFASAQDKQAIQQMQEQVKKEWHLIEEEKEELAKAKINLARQRVEFLKEKASAKSALSQKVHQ